MNLENGDCEFFYAPRCGVLLALLTMLAGCGVACGGGYLQGLLETLPGLPPAGARLAVQAAYGVCLIVAGLAACVIANRVLWPRKISVTNDGIQLPRRHWRRSAEFIAFRHVSAVRASVAQRQRLLTIVHADGQESIAASLFDSRFAFDKLYEELAARLERAAEPRQGNQLTLGTLRRLPHSEPGAVSAI